MQFLIEAPEPEPSSSEEEAVASAVVVDSKPSSKAAKLPPAQLKSQVVSQTQSSLGFFASQKVDHFEEFWETIKRLMSPHKIGNYKQTVLALVNAHNNQFDSKPAAAAAGVAAKPKAKSKSPKAKSQGGPAVGSKRKRDSPLPSESSESTDDEAQKKSAEEEEEKKKRKKVGSEAKRLLIDMNSKDGPDELGTRRRGRRKL